MAEGGTTTSATTAMGGNSMLPWHLVPSFKPGETDIDDYSRRMMFLSGIWPPEFIHLLAPRAAMACEGSAFQKVIRIPTEKLKVQSEAGVKLLVQTLGGVWGKTTLETLYERFERALYTTVQKSDETHESYMARHEVQFEDLLTQGAKLEDIRAYVLLRNSGLTSEEKKKIIVDSEGKLSYSKVIASLRLLGSRFFQEVQSGGKTSHRNKTYEINYVQEEDEEDTFMTVEDFVNVEHADLADQVVDQLAHEGDEDAALMLHFEEQLIESVQNDPDLSILLTTYTEARRRLTERVKNRGFWPVSKKGKGKGYGGKSKGKHNRKPLAVRIAESHCRKCLQKGHWKWECPNAPASSNVNNGRNPTANAMTVVTEDYVEDFDDILEVLPSDGLQEPAEEQNKCVRFCFENQAFVSVANKGHEKSHLGHKVTNIHGPDRLLCRLRSTIRSDTKNRHHIDQYRMKPRDKRDKTPLSQEVKDRVEKNHRPVEVIQEKSTPQESSKHPAIMKISVGENSEPILFASQGCYGIVDLGASQSVMGHHQVEEFLTELPTTIQDRVKEQEVAMTFRFGNNSTVSSNRAMLIPIGPVWLRIAIVDSRTPFLISNTVFRSLGAIIDTQGHIVHFKKLNCSVPLKLSDRRLFMLSIAELIQSAEKLKRVQCEPADQGSDKPIVLHVTEQTETQNIRKEPEPSSESSPLTPTDSNHKRTQEESVNLGPHENSTIIPSAQPVSVQQGSPDMQDQPLKTDGVRDKSNPSSDVISHGQQHAVSLQGSSEEHGGDRPGRRLVGNGHHHTATSDHEVWDSKAGTRVPRGGEGCKVLFMVPGSLPGLTEASSQGVSPLPAPLHRDDRGSPGRTKTNHRKERCGLQEPQHEGLSQGQSQEFYGTWHTLPDGDRGRAWRTGHR